MLRCAVALAQASSLRQANGIGLRRAFSADVLNKVSATITQPKSQGASQAMLYATGLKEEDMKKAQACWRAAAVGFSSGVLCESPTASIWPQVGIASVWYEGNPCNMHLLDLSQRIKAECVHIRPGLLAPSAHSLRRSHHRSAHTRFRPILRPRSERRPGCGHGRHALQHDRRV